MSTTPQAGDQIGPYRLVRLLGEGGFAKVWQAQQKEPLTREVALKMLKPGMASAEVLSRFQAELEAQAQMQHPGIARVLDAGHTSQGQPYLVMELVVAASPITTWCAGKALGLSKRLSLFLDLCAAIQHAHQQGIIHRDLKPSNVLISGSGEVKVIDFGIAKALSEADLTHTLVLGTHGYMSPEQAAGSHDIDTRSDVFALGALLQDLIGKAPPRDLRWIIQRAREPERHLRYASVNALGDDLRRFTDGRPITARTATFSYLTSRFIRRHRLSSAAVLTALLSLGAGSGVAMKQADLARQEKHQSEAMSDLLVSSWESLMPTKTESPRLLATLRSVMARMVEPSFAGRPSTCCRVLIKISEAAGIQSDYQLGLEAATHAHELIRKHPDISLGAQIDCLTSLGNITNFSGDPKTAIPYLAKAYDLCLKAAGPISKLSLTRLRMLGSALSKAHDPQAAPVLESVIKNGRTLQLPDTHTDILQARSDLAATLLDLDRSDEALTLLSQTIEHARSGGESLRSVLSRLLLRRGLLMVRLKRDQDAITAYSEAENETLKSTNPDTAFLFILRYNTSLALMRLGRSAEAEPILEQLFEDQVRHFKITHRQPRTTALKLAMVQSALGHWSQLETLLDRVLGSVAATFGYPFHNEHIEVLAKHFDASGQLEKASSWRMRAAAETRKVMTAKNASRK